MTEYDFKQVVLFDIEGVQVPDTKPPYKMLANSLYQNTKNIDMLEIARHINQGKPVQLRPSELKEVQAIIKSGFVAFAAKAFLDYIDNVEKEKRKN